MSNKLLWKPSPERVAQANVTAFIRQVQKLDPDVTDFGSLYRWSVREPEAFWAAVWDFCGVQASSRWDWVVRDFDQMPGCRWFGGARLNFAQNLLRFQDEQPALISWSERGREKSLSYRQLANEAGRLAGALRQAGIGPGDRVAGFLPNIPETVIAMLATARLGAIWSSCSPDFGVKGVLDRFGQIQPRVLFAADGYRYAGRSIDSLSRVRGILHELPKIEHVVIVPYRRPQPDLSGLPHGRPWAEFVESGSGEPRDYEHFPFDQPLYIMYSSGTTGLPKCMVHGSGGTLLQHFKELVLHTDLKREDVIFYYTTCGWMMWNWLVSSLAVGATVLLYDGSPFHPAESILWEMAESEGITVFGASAKYLALLEKKGVEPATHFDLSGLKAILSTGSPLAPQSFEYVYREVKSDVCLASISGGTDLISCFALGNPIGPVYSGELQTRGLGMSVKIFDSEGKPVVGRAGELVCTQPFPSMPVRFWNDPEGEKYRRAYFDHYPGVWRHGDWAELTPRGGMIIYGRSDATLNPGGVRIGTAEIYRHVEKLDDILECLAVGQEHDGDVRVVLFVRLREGVRLTSELEKEIRKVIRENTSPHHVPKKIVEVSDLPRTISGKISELAVRDAIHGRPIANQDALANPEALDQFRELAESL